MSLLPGHETKGESGDDNKSCKNLNWKQQCQCRMLSPTCQSQ